MQYLNQKILEALEFAAVAHKEQRRKSPGEVPYISHVAAVGLILARAGFDDEVITAGILHDTLEDTRTTEEQLRQRFGSRVADLVLAVTENKDLPWLERKESYDERLGQAPEEAAAISAADLLANRQSQLLLLRQGKNPWPYFSEDPQEYTVRLFAHDQDRIAIIEQRLRHPIVMELKALEKETVELTRNLQWE